MRRGFVVWLVATGAVLVVAGLGVRWWLLRDRTEPVDVHRVVGRFRAAPAPASRRPGTVPAAGVCEYATTGGERAALLGTSRHDYPATTAIAIIPAGCGVTAQWQALDLWLARDTGLPVRIRAEVANETDTPIGRRVSYRERYDLRLRSLTPRR